MRDYGESAGQDRRSAAPSSSVPDPADDGAREPATVLVLEDDPVLAGPLARRLARDHEVGEVVTTLEAARAAMAAQHYHCLVLDRRVPDGDAIDLVAEVHSRSDRPVVLILSAMADTEERIRGLGLGADEYMVKPSPVEEVAERVRTLVDRAASAPELVVRIGSVMIDRARHEVTIDGKPVWLGPRAYAVLDHLMVHQGRVVETEELLEHCWDRRRRFFSNPLRSLIYRLRVSFRHHLTFDSVHDVGYVLRALEER